jgi:hypothetical protein
MRKWDNFREIFVFATIFAKTSRKFRENEKSIKFDRAETKISFLHFCEKRKFSRKCQNENFRFNPSRTLTLITYSFFIKISVFLPANSPWLRLVFHFRIFAKIRKFSRKCKKMRANENKFSRKCQNENFRFNPSRTLTLITYSFFIKISFFLPANSPWLRLVLVRPDLSSTDRRT